MIEYKKDRMLERRGRRGGEMKEGKRKRRQKKRIWGKREMR